MKKRAISLILTLCLIMGMVPSTVFAAEVVASGTCGENLTWVLTDDGTLTVSGEGAMTDYSNSNDAPWYSWASSIKTVYVENGVATIGNNAYYDYDSLTSITFGDSVTTIGERAFFGCDNLPNITIGENVTAIGDSAFRYCSNLTCIHVVDGNYTYSSDDVGVLFNKEKTVLIQAPGAITGHYSVPDSVVAISDWAFSYCFSLTSVTTGDGVITIGEHAFTASASLVNLTIGENVTAIGNCAFIGCYNLTGILVASENPAYSNDELGVLFDKEKTVLICAPGTISGHYSLPNSVVTIGGSAFSYCSDLTSVEIPNGVTTIGDNAFIYTGLTSVEIPNGVTTIDDFAFGYGDLTSVTIPISVTYIGEHAFPYGLLDVYYGGSESQWAAIEIGRSNASLTNATIHYQAKESEYGTTLYLVPNANWKTDNARFAVYCWNDSGSTWVDMIASNEEGVYEVAIPTGYTNIIFCRMDPTNINNEWDAKWNQTADLTIPTDGSNCYIIADDAWDTGGIWSVYDPEAGATDTTRTVHYFHSWDAENQIAYFDSDPSENPANLGSQVTEETDTSFLKNVDLLVGHYVLVEAKTRDDGMIAPDILISIKPVQTKTGTVSSVDDSTIVIDGTAYGTPTDWVLPENCEGKTVVYHLYEDRLAGYEVLQVETGVLQYWSTATKKLSIDPDGLSEGLNNYMLSNLANEASVDFLGVSGYTNIAVQYEMDRNGFIYSISKYVPSEGPNFYETYVPMTEDEVRFFKLAEDWMEAYEKFVVAVDKAMMALAGSDKETREDIISRQAEAMQRNDSESSSQYLTGNLGEHADEAYHALATFFYDYTCKNAEFSSVDLSGTMAETTIVNNVIKAMWHEKKEYEYEHATIAISAFGYGSTAMGQMTIRVCDEESEYVFSDDIVICSTQKDCEEAVSAYIEELQGLATNAAYNVATSLYKDILGKPLSSLTKEYVSSTISKLEKKLAVVMTEKFNKAGVGDIINTLDDCYTYFTWVYKAANSGNLDDLQTAMTTVTNLKFEDDTIKDGATSLAMKGLKKTAKSIRNAYEGYLKDLGTENATIYGKALINCPVNVNVYNSSGEQVGYVGNDDIWYTDAIRISEVGGAKEITSYTDDLLSYEMVATAYGTMSCSFEEYDEDGKPLGRLNYYNILIEPNQMFSVSLVDDLNTNATNLTIVTGEASIKANEFVDVTDEGGVVVTCAVENNGDVKGVGAHIRGDAVVLIAVPEEGYKFGGWYEGEALISSTDVFEFTAMSDRHLTAKFYRDDYVYVSVIADNGGCAVGNGRYFSGDIATVIAAAEENFNFVGWYINNEQVSTDAEYQFTVTENMELMAKFECADHLMTNEDFVWSENYAECVAIFSCASCGNSHSVDCSVTSETIPATGTKDGRIVYTAAIEFNGQTYTDTKTVTIPTVGVTRIFGATRYDTAFKAADQLKENLGIEKFENIVVAYGEDFADALSGSYLANQKNAPILLVKNRNKEINLVKDYIKANLTPGGTVYLLGGVNAVPKAMESGLEGFNVKRLAGATRYETNLEILKEAGISGSDILVCTGLDFADGLSASAVNKPILLVKDSLRATQVNYMKTLGTKNFYLIGGTNAVNTRIENALKTYGTTQRIEGATRYYTSVNIAKTFFPDAKTAVLAYAQNFPDGLSGGCLACSMNAPLILTANGKQAPAVAYAKEAGITGGAVLGGTGLIPDRVANAIFQIS